MWENLTPADIEQAKDELRQRRDEVLRRQAEETRGLDAEQADIEALDRMLGAFAGKFGTAPARPPEPADTSDEEAVAVEAQAVEEPAVPAPAPALGSSPAAAPRSAGSDRAAAKKGILQSNFDTFARALSKSI